MNRRDLLKAAAAATPLVFAGRAFAAPAADTRLLVVFLRGAYDAANVVAPTASAFYHQARPGIGLAAPDPLNPKRCGSTPTGACTRRWPSRYTHCGRSGSWRSCRSPEPTT